MILAAIKQITTYSISRCRTGSVELEVNGKINNTTWNGELSNVTLSDKKLSFSNTKNIAVMFNSQNGNFDVSAHCWASQQSELCIDTLAQTKELGQLNAKLNNLALKSLNTFCQITFAHAVI